MDFTFTEDQVAFRDSMSRFLMTEAAPEMLREVWETDSGRSAELRAKIAEQGLTGLSVPEAEGGLGLGDIDWALMTQELGYYAIPDSLADTAYVAVGVLTALPVGHALRAQWLPTVVDGSARIAVGHPVNPWVADAHMADLMLLSRRTGQGTLALHALPRQAMRLAPLPSIDASRRLSNVDWSPMPHSCFAEGATAQQAWDAALDRGAINAAGQLVGLAQRMLDLSVDYVAQRKQFGKAIGSFQAVKHHLADARLQLSFAAPMVHRAAHSLANGDPDAHRHVSMAKAMASEAVMFVGEQALQCHGAIGYTTEYDLHLYLKRSWALASRFGDARWHRRRVAAALGLDPLT